MPPVTIALVGLIALLVLIPTRRLFLAGWRRDALTAYYLVVLVLGTLVAVVRGPATFLVPILLVAWLAPFVTLRDGIDRLLGRSGPAAGGGDRDGVERPGGPRAVKDVTPPDERSR